MDEKPTTVLIRHPIDAVQYPHHVIFLIVQGPLFRLFLVPMSSRNAIENLHGIK